MDADNKPARGRRLNWINISTVVSAVILIGAEVFGAAFAGSWAIATLFELEGIFALVIQVVLLICGVAVMTSFIRGANRVEPFVTNE